MDIMIVGPRDTRDAAQGRRLINTTSRSIEDWSKGFSPFFLGPVPLYGGMSARRMENAWQFAKVYPSQLDHDGRVTSLYWDWAFRGWAAERASRHPMGIGKRPAFTLWDGERLGYVEARRRVYVPLYQSAVAATREFSMLYEMAQREPIALWDFDGYDNRARGRSLRSVLDDPSRPMGHAFVLKAMLMKGPDVRVEDWPEEVELRVRPPSEAGRAPGLFDAQEEIAL